MKKLIDKLNSCYLNNGNARHIDYESAEEILGQFKIEVKEEILILAKVMTEHLNQNGRNEWFDMKINKLQK